MRYPVCCQCNVLCSSWYLLDICITWLDCVVLHYTFKVWKELKTIRLNDSSNIYDARAFVLRFHICITAVNWQIYLMLTRLLEILYFTMLCCTCFGRFSSVCHIYILMPPPPPTSDRRIMFSGCPSGCLSVRCPLSPKSIMLSGPKPARDLCASWSQTCVSARVVSYAQSPPC